MAERTFQFGGEEKFSSILKVAGVWISSYQSADIFLFPSLSLSLYQCKAINLSSLPVCHKAGMNLTTCSCENWKKKKRGKNK